MDENPYQAAEADPAPRKTRATLWLVWSGVALLVAAAGLFVTTLLHLMWTFDSLASSPNDPDPADLARGASDAWRWSAASPALAIVGIVLVVVGFVVRQPDS